MNSTPESEIAQLQSLVKALAWNDAYGCYTRAGFEKLIWPEIAHKAQYIIFLDIDNMHELNEAHGYDAVNVMIRKSLTMRDSDYVAGQLGSGDEILICITEDNSRPIPDPVALCERLREIFAANGVPATFAIAKVTSRDLVANIKPAYDLVQAEKKADRRGRINQVK